MKRKTIQPKIRPFKGATLVAFADYDSSDLLDFVAGMGYLLYEDPSDSNCAIISDKRLTYGDVKKMAHRFDIDLDWWNNDTDLNSLLNDELDELNY